MSIFSQLIINSIIAGSLYALVAVGFNLIYGATRFFNLAHGSMAVIGGYTVFFLTRTYDWNIFVSVGLGLLAAGLFGYLSDRLVYRPLRERKASSMVLLVASLGIFTVIQAVIAIMFTSQFQTLTIPEFLVGSITILGAIITKVQLVIVVSAIVTTFGLILLLNKTMFGRAIRAISDDEDVAKIIGINTEKIIAWVFVIGSAIAGLSGILIGFDTGLEPTMGMALLLKGVIAAIIGGVGNIYGALLGAFLLGLVENFGIWQISGEWKDAIAFVLLILFLVFRPKGIINS